MLARESQASALQHALTADGEALQLLPFDIPACGQGKVDLYNIICRCSCVRAALQLQRSIDKHAVYYK